MLGARVGICNSIKAFSLRERPNLQLWLDSSDSTTMLNAAGTAAVLDEQIATWQDKSGNNRHMIQETSTKRPKRQVINNINAVTFTKAIQSHLYNGYEIGSQTFTIVFVYNNSNQYGTVWDLSGNAANNGEFFIESNGNSINMFVGRGGTAYHTLKKFYNQAGTIAVGIINYGVVNGFFNLYLENISGVFFNNTYSYDVFLFTGGISLGIQPSDSGQYLEGQIYEFAVYNRSIKDTEKTDIIRLLKEKYF
jgi:hypothetical protein